MTASVQYKGDHVYVAFVNLQYAGRAKVDDAGNFVRFLSVRKQFRRQGVAMALLRFIAQHRGRKLTPAPDKSKTDVVRALGAKYGAEILES